MKTWTEKNTLDKENKIAKNLGVLALLALYYLYI